MQAGVELQNDSIQDALIKAVLYSFAMCDYEGAEPITLKSVSSCELFDGAHIDVVNKSFAAAQRATLIEWDEAKIGGIRLTKTGVARFILVRDDFFDADALRLLKEKIEKVEMARQEESTATIIRAKAGQPCPRSGVWQSQEAQAREQIYLAGDIMNDLRSAYGLTLWLWIRD
jgi:hypothetical protein